MSNPLDNNELTFYLTFNNEEVDFGEVPITEAVKFDGATYIVEQDSERYGRDVEFLNDSIDLFFYKGFYDATENPLMLPNGTIVYNLTQGYEHLYEILELKGFESDVTIGIRKNGIDFVLGNLDFQNAEADEYSYISCKAIQTTDKAQIARRNEISVDVFSDKNLDDETITPLETFNVLLKAKPIVQVSKWSFITDYWKETGIRSSGNLYLYGLNPIATVINGGIDNTISFLDRSITFSTSGTDLNEKIYNMGLVSAQYDLTDNTITLTDVSFSIFIEEGTSFNDGWQLPEQEISFRGYKYLNDSNPTGSILTDNILHKTWRNENTNTNPNVSSYSVIFAGTESVDRFSGFTGNADRYVVTIPEITLDVDNIPVNHRGCFFFSIPKYEGINIIEWISGDLEMTSTSTAIDTVINAVRYIDLFKQNIKSINGFQTYAPRFDVGGEFYDQIAVNGNLIKRRNDVPFYVNLNDLMDTLKEVNGDYQTLDDKVYISVFDDFYANKEIGVLTSFPDYTCKRYTNDRFALLNVNYQYSNYETDDDEEDTIDSFQTSSQWLYPNKQTDSVKEVTLKQIRDSFKIEKTRREAIKDTTSTDEDYKLFIVDIVSLSPTANNTISISVSHNINSDGNLQLLNDASFSWLVIGINVGDDIELLDTDNAGIYEVLAIEDTIITLQGGTDEGLNILTTIKYFYTGVNYVSRTNEGFTLIENILNPDKIANLRYSIKRNLKHWYSYLATAGKYWINKTLKNTEFINNGLLTTQYGSETTPTVENEDINIIDLGTPKLSDRIYELKLVVSYEVAVNILNAIKTVNDDDTIGGFIRTFNNNGKVIKLYPQKLEFEPATETLTLTGEEKYENDVINVYKENDIIYVSDVPYDINKEMKWFDISNDYLIIYDSNNLPIINPTHYSKVTVNDVYSSINIELSKKLIDI